MGANRIRELRKANHMSQEELAEIVGVTRSAVSSWEQGTRTLLPYTAVRLSEFFGVTVNYLCGKVDHSEFINTLITKEIDITKLNNEGVSELTSYYKFLLTRKKYTHYEICNDLD